MEIVDYHVHSTNSFDGKSSIEEVCKKALDMGLIEVCFTEHFSVDPRDVSYGVLNYEKYSLEIERAKEKFFDKLKINKGLEIGEPHLKQFKKDLENQLIKMDLDFIIGSVHNIDGVKLRTYIQNKSKYNIYYDYFNEIYNMVLNSDIDVVGHMDLIKRYSYELCGNYSFDDYREIIKKILIAMIDKGIGLEVNGSGYEDKVGEFYPILEILTLYRNIGSEIITVCSDYHWYGKLAKHNLKMMNVLKEIGFNFISTFEKRKIKNIRI